MSENTIMGAINYQHDASIDEGFEAERAVI
jgi:hypothetical protein